MTEKAITTEAAEHLLSADELEQALTLSGPKRYLIRVSPDSDEQIAVWIKELNWIEREQALAAFMKIDARKGDLDIDFAGYWRHLLEKCVVKTEPNMGLGQLLTLNAYVGGQVKALLPDITSLTSTPLESSE